MRKILLALVLLLAFTQAGAESRYVTDQFKITLRAGESSGHKILKMLPSGTELELLGSNPETGYSRVRTRDGKTGYVLTRQLMKIPSARDRLVKAEKRLQELQAEPDALSARLSKLQGRHQQLQREYDALKASKQKLDKELESIRRTASNAIRISNERNELRKMVAKLTREVEDLKQENRELSNDSNQKWFLIGAAVIILGIILGLILPHLRFQKRKSSWGSL
ncbi:MAG TPA: TIGR04211 family SH3 domain-containing protein [Sedimenticola thiotaurini]|uniref:TIGR04211 family SH3 domain-containing protein n=1 Tax=Sedimenticola thiotaurini TaxID=1543721 RepID=A0A831RL28_9GAMM|nr:TIGR04211 family SH3 domain-containing protein [Sedimenticola thiotaurini]